MQQRKFVRNFNNIGSLNELSILLPVLRFNIEVELNIFLHGNQKSPNSAGGSTDFRAYKGL
ncbi:MAG: hypothetical protein FJ218_01885 [Ignavibacteria bacterium]|nr:hypothetical protein [Ignavibacteria bacterium]